MSAVAPAAATRFLTALAQAISTASLYSGEHPSREKACDVLFTELRALIDTSPQPKFSFLGEEVIFGRLAMRSLRDWSLGARLSKAGVQWLEFDAAIKKEDIRGFVDDVSAILSAPSGVPIDPLLFQRTGIRWGAVAIKKNGRGSASGEHNVVGGGGGGGWAAPDGGEIGGGFVEEVETTRWIATALDGGRSIPLAEAQAVVRSLAVALHQDRDVLQPLYRLGPSPDSTSHSIGVAILAMAFAEHLGTHDSEVRTIGIAALLHDVGLTRVPSEILTKPTELTSEEQAEYQKHPEHGARMLLSAEKDLSLPAVVAYEHHISPDGAGYPVFRHPRDVHHVSKMVSICSAYHARRSNMPFRPAMEGRAVLNHIEWYAGTKYDAELAIAFVAMLREAEGAHANGQ